MLLVMSLVMQLPRYEGYGMTPLEGMASGVPFVASDTGYYRAFSAQGRCGTVVPLADPTAAAAAAARALLSDSATFNPAATAARDIAQSTFSARAEADGIASVYDRLWSAA